MRSFYTIVEGKPYKYEVRIDDKFVSIMKIWNHSEDMRDNVVAVVSMRRDEYEIIAESIEKSLKVDIYINKGD